MTRPYRTLLTADKVVAVAEPPDAEAIAAVESDYVVILAALLCALICVVGLIAVARCAWLRRGNSEANNSRNRSPNAENNNKGMKKKMIEVLPKFTYEAEKEDKRCEMMVCSSECAICLGEYVNGDEIRVLPQCRHGFHLECIDMWLISHSSCPSCRQVLVPRRCKKCGEFPTISANVT